jgi:gliding motility-associated-like protein
VGVGALSSFTTYQWQDGSKDSVFFANDEGLVTLNVSNTCGSASAQLTVSRVTVNGPNVFTPNNDGANDVLYFDNHLSMAPQLKVHNRWGMEVFKDQHYHNDWDGGDLSAGVYYYDLNYAGCDIYKSWLEIIK